jgi:hypothetical protein
MPGTLEELQHQNFHPLPNGAQSRTHGRGGLALPGSGVNDDQTAFSVSHEQF